MRRGKSLALAESKKNASFNSFYHNISVSLSCAPTNQSMCPRIEPPNNMFIVSVIVLDQLKDNVYMPTNQFKSNYALASDLVTITLETQESDTIFKPRDVLSLDNKYRFNISFDGYTINHTNQLTDTGTGLDLTGGSRLQCGQMLEHRLLLRLATSCRLDLRTSPHDPTLMVPNCLCKRAGTYGLMELRPSVLYSQVLKALPSMPVIYGCLTSMIMSLLSWSILIKSCKQSSKKFYTTCKVMMIFFLLLRFHELQKQNITLHFSKKMKPAAHFRYQPR